MLGAPFKGARRLLARQLSPRPILPSRATGMPLTRCRICWGAFIRKAATPSSWGATAEFCDLLLAPADAASHQLYGELAKRNVATLKKAAALRVC